MTVKGTIIEVMPIASGISQRGNAWSKQEYVIETDERYPKKIAFTVMNDNIAAFNLSHGAKYAIELEVESHEYQGRWYTSALAWKATPV